MPVGSASWSFTQDDFDAITQTLQRFLYDSNARCALLVDRTGQLVATVGEQPNFDPTAFATLTAADFSANDQLARLIGESDFSTLFHQGERESMYLADVARRVILVVLFDNRTTLGLVRLKMKLAVDELTKLFEAVFEREKATQAARPNILAGAEDVYYGPGIGGKTTNLEHVYGKVSPDTRGKLISLATETERTLFFDFLPVDLGTIRGFRTRFHLYTVPGQVYYNASRKLILKGVDGVVFVADSQTERMEANMESMQNLYDNMAEHGYDITRMPFVVQYNKRDLPNAAPLAELQAALNPGWEVTEAARQRAVPDPQHPGELLVQQLDTGEWVERAPHYEAVAVSGDGVFDTLKAVSKLVLKSLA